MGLSEAWPVLPQNGEWLRPRDGTSICFPGFSAPRIAPRGSPAQSLLWVFVMGSLDSAAPSGGMTARGGSCE